MNDITKENLEQHMLEAIPKLLEMARDLTTNDISDNCFFILTDIEHVDLHPLLKRRLDKVRNDAKTPLPFNQMMAQLLAIYSDLYDINLEVYLAQPGFTVVEARYFRRSAMDENTRLQLMSYGPMLHCKVAHPPGYMDNKQRFDINWRHSMEYLG